MSGGPNNVADEAGGQSGLTLTPSEATMFFAVLKHNKNKLEVDWDLVAQETGLKNAGVSRTRFGQIRRKHGIVIGEGTTTASTTLTTGALEGVTPEGTPTKQQRTPRKRATPSGGGGGESKTPRKKGRRTKTIGGGDEVDDSPKKEEDDETGKDLGDALMSEEDRTRADTNHFCSIFMKSEAPADESF